MTVRGESTRVVLADDHHIFRQALKTLMTREGIDVVGEAADGDEAVELTREHQPDVTILDFGMPRMNGIDAARQIQESVPGTQTVLLTMHDDESLALEAIHLSGGMSKTALDAYATGAKAAPDPLTDREREVLRMIAEGKTTRDIAAELRLSPKTVESHRNRLMQKLEIHGTAGLTRYAIRRHLIMP